MPKFDELSPSIDSQLDEKPWDLNIFESGKQALTQERAWRDLERYYRRQQDD